MVNLFIRFLSSFFYNITVKTNQDLYLGDDKDKGNLKRGPPKRTFYDLPKSRRERSPPLPPEPQNPFAPYLKHPRTSLNSTAKKHNAKARLTKACLRQRNTFATNATTAYIILRHSFLYPADISQHINRFTPVTMWNDVRKSAISHMA